MGRSREAPIWGGSKIGQARIVPTLRPQSAFCGCKKRAGVFGIGVGVGGIKVQSTDTKGTDSALWRSPNDEIWMVILALHGILHYIYDTGRRCIGVGHGEKQ